MRLRTVLAACAALVGPAASNAESLDEPIVHGRAPIASLTVVGGEGGQWDQLLVYALNDAAPGQPGSRLLLRSEVYPNRALRVVRWTSSDDCPVARAIVRGLMTVQPPPPRTAITLDGTDVWIARAPAAGSIESFSADFDADNAPRRLALWAEKALRPCWRRDLASVAF